MEAVFTKKEPPQWLLDMWKEIDDKTFGKGFNCFTETSAAGKMGARNLWLTQPRDDASFS